MLPQTLKLSALSVLLAGALLAPCDAQVTLAWNPPTNSAVVGYYFCWGTNSGQYTATNSYPNTQSSCTISSLAAGQAYYFAIQSFAADGSVSAFSNEASFTNAAVLPPLVIAANTQNRVYGSPNPPFTVTYSGFLNGDTPAVLSGALSFTTSAGATNSPGTYPLIPGGVSSPNYAISFSNGVLTVLPAPLTISAGNATCVYGQSNPTLSGSVVGLVNNDNLGVTCTTTATPTSPPGSYAIVPSLSDPNQILGNYVPAINNGVLAVSPAPLTVTAANQTQVSGQPTPTLTGAITGVVNGDNITASYNSTATVSSPAGTYPIVPSLSDPQSKLGNYTVIVANGTLTITASSGSTNSGGSVSGGSTGSTNPTGSTSTNSASAVSLVTLAWNPSIDTNVAGCYFCWGTNSGVYIFTNSYPGTQTTCIISNLAANQVYFFAVQSFDTNGSVSAFSNEASFTNGPASTNGTSLPSLVIIAKNQSRVYGSPNPQFTATYSGFVNGDTPAALSGTLSFTSPAGATSAPGNYPIIPGGVSSANYAISFSNGVLAVTQAPLTISASNTSRLYGQPNPALGGSVAGLANNDNLGLTFVTTATAASPAGAYAISPALSDPNQKLANYNVSLNNGTLTVSQALLTVSANGASRSYGTTNPVFSATISGFANGDNTNVLTGHAALSTSATPASPVGTYNIVVAQGSLAAVNYSFGINNGTLTVTPASLTGAVQNVARGYGQTNPLFGVSYQGFVNNDDTNVLTGTITYSCLDTNSLPAGTNSPIGIYPITVPSGQSGANYNLMYVPGALSVTQAVLTVTADPQSRLYGATNPALTVSYTGFANGDGTNVLSGQPELSTLASTPSSVGSYDILVALGSLSATNYSLVLSNGTLTVGQTPLAATAANATQVVGLPSPPLIGTLTGVYSGDNITAIYTSSATPTTPLGTYPIVPSLSDPQNKLGNYLVRLTNGTLTLTAATAATGSGNLPSGGSTGSTPGGSSSSNTLNSSISESPVQGVPPILSLTLTNGSQPFLQISGTVGADLMIQTSTNPLNSDSWTTLTNLAITNAALNIQSNTGAPSALVVAFVPAAQAYQVNDPRSPSLEFYRVEMPYDYVVLADSVLSGEGFPSRLLLINMPGVQNADVCYVTPQTSFLTYDATNQAFSVDPSGSAIRQIADTFAGLLGQNWTTASEFSYSNGVSTILATVVKTEPPSSDPVAVPSTPIIQIDF